MTRRGPEEVSTEFRHVKWLNNVCKSSNPIETLSLQTMLHLQKLLYGHYDQTEEDLPPVPHCALA